MLCLLDGDNVVMLLSGMYMLCLLDGVNVVMLLYQACSHVMFA